MTSSSTIIRLQPTGPNRDLDRWDDIQAAEIESGRPVQRGHYYLQDKANGVAAGVWDCTGFTSKPTSFGFHEFILILEGEVTVVEEDGRETTVQAGQSFVVPQGVVHRWVQPGYVRKYFVTFSDGSAEKRNGAQRVIRADPNAALDDSPPPPASVLLSPVPVQHSLDCFTDPTGQWTMGVWDTTAYHRKAIPFSRHELMHFLEGSVTLTDGAGTPHRFEAGDSLFVPLGAVCDWRCEGYLRKIYCIYQPAG